MNNQAYINSIVKANNMIEITTNRQKQNGTVAFLCVNTRAIYTSHANGYVRRKTWDYKTGKTAQYQLNRVDAATGKRIMIDDNVERLCMIINAMQNYNNTFNKRFMALSIFQVPNMLEYSSYRTIKELPKEVEMDRLITACAECFDAARGALSELEKTRMVKPLLRVCVRNSLVVSMGRKMSWECGIQLEYTEHESYPVFVVGPKS